MKNCLLKAFFVSVLFLQNNFHATDHCSFKEIHAKCMNAFFNDLKEFFKNAAETQSCSHCDFQVKTCIRDRSMIEIKIFTQFAVYLKSLSSMSIMQLVMPFIVNKDCVEFGLNTRNFEEKKAIKVVLFNLLRHMKFGESGFLRIGLPSELVQYKSVTIHGEPSFYSCPVVYSMWIMLNEFFVFLLSGNYESLHFSTQKKLKEGFSDKVFIDELKATLDFIFNLCQEFSITTFPVDTPAIRQEVVRLGEVLSGILSKKD